MFQSSLRLDRPKRDGGKTSRQSAVFVAVRRLPRIVNEVRIRINLSDWTWIVIEGKKWVEFLCQVSSQWDDHGSTCSEVLVLQYSMYPHTSID
jgi:hypothetical protein